MSDGSASTTGATGEDVVPSSSAFTVHERRLTENAVFVYTTYNGDAGPSALPPLAVPRKAGDCVEAPAQLGASAVNSVFVMANSTVGAGVLSLPFAFQETGEPGHITCTCEGPESLRPCEAASRGHLLLTPIHIEFVQKFWAYKFGVLWMARIVVLRTACNRSTL